MPKDWELYEHQIFQKFEHEAPNCTVTKNYKLKGRTSNEERQIDILVEGKFGTIPLRIAVECKCFSRKIDVKGVEAFIGMLGDINVDKGVMITTKGFSKAAEQRARAARIMIDIVAFDDWDDYDVADFEYCDLCEPGEDQSPGTVCSTDGNKVSKRGKTACWSYCSRCNGINVYCKSCGCVTGVDEGYYDEPVECNGGCGIEFVVSSTHDGDGLFSEDVEIV